MSGDALATAAKEPKTYILILLMILVGTEFTPLGGSREPSADEKRLQILEADARDRKLMEDISDDMEVTVRESLAPIVQKLDKLDAEMARGTRWSLEDEVKLWEANGKIGPDPRQVQGERLAREYRENSGR